MPLTCCKKNGARLHSKEAPLFLQQNRYSQLKTKKMKRTVLLFTFTISTFLCLSQDFELIDSYLSPISAKTYLIGDSITIGNPEYNRNGSVNYSNVLHYKKERLNSLYSKLSYSHLNQDLSNNTAVIQKIYSNKENEVREFRNSVVLEVITTENKTLFIPIDKALISKEVIVYPNFLEIDGLLPFNNQNATILAIKSENLSKEETMLKYIYKTNQKKFNEWKENEFTYEKEKISYINTIDSLFSTVDQKDTMVIILPVSLGSYSFEKGSFPVVESIQKYSKKVNFAFSNEYLSFVNFSNFSEVIVSKDRAEYFVNSTKKQYDETRTAFVIIKATLEDLSIQEKSGGMNIDDRPTITIDYSFKITELHCVDHSALYYNYLGYQK